MDPRRYFKLECGHHVKPPDDNTIAIWCPECRKMFDHKGSDLKMEEMKEKITEIVKSDKTPRVEIADPLGYLRKLEEAKKKVME